MVDLTVDFCGLSLENPFILAPSSYLDNLNMLNEAFEAGWAGVVLRTALIGSENINRVYPMVSRVESEDGRLMALQNLNPVSEYPIEMIEQIITSLKKRFPHKAVMASITFRRKEECLILTQRLIAAGADLIECTIPLNDISEGITSFHQEYTLFESIIKMIKENSHNVPMVVKLTPQIPDIPKAAAAVKRSGADGICAMNMLKSITGVDLDTLIPYPNVGGLSTFGGLFGPAVKPIALRCTAEIARKVNIDIASSGGIMNWRDAAEFLLLGAKTLQICTAILQHGIGVIHQFTDGLQAWMEAKGFQSMADIQGKSLPYLVEHYQLPRGIQVVASIKTQMCNHCSICISACRAGGNEAIYFEDQLVPKVDITKCKGCGICQAICSERAIFMARPAKAKRLATS